MLCDILQQQIVSVFSFWMILYCFVILDRSYCLPWVNEGYIYKKTKQNYEHKYMLATLLDSVAFCKTVQKLTIIMQHAKSLVLHTVCLTINTFHGTLSWPWQIAFTALQIKGFGVGACLLRPCRSVPQRFIYYFTYAALLVTPESFF